MKTCTVCRQERRNFYTSRGGEWDKCQSCHQNEIRVKKEKNSPMHYADFLRQAGYGDKVINQYKSKVKYRV